MRLKTLLLVWFHIICDVYGIKSHMNPGVLPRPQWTPQGCLVHHTHLHNRHHIPLSEQTHSLFVGTSPTIYRLPCTQDCQTAHKQY